jgi:WS/DGAT/MGAT family acyltransferase
MTTRLSSSNPHDFERLTPSEAHLLELERRRGLHMHTGCVLMFDGSPPTLEQFTEHIRSRLHLVPRYRRHVVSVPYGVGRPLWVDDPLLALGFHVRAAALPAEGGERELFQMVGELLSAQLDRGKPLWEIWLVGPLVGERFAVIAKTHCALVDGDVNRDLLSVLVEPAEAPQPHAPAWDAPPPPTPAELVLGALVERARDPRSTLRTARTVASRAREELEWRDVGSLGSLGASPRSLLNRPIGRQRHYAHVEVGLGRLRKDRERLGGTINDAILTAVAGAVGGLLRLRGEDTDGLVLRVLLPLLDATSTRLLASHVPLPAGISDPRRRHAGISRALDGLAAAGRVRGARELTTLAGFAPPTLLGPAARLQAGQRAFNLAVTNIPGPSTPRRLLGRELRAILPAMPLARNQTLSVAIASFCGRLHFGLLADGETLGDPNELAALLETSLAELRKGARGKTLRSRP